MSIETALAQAIEDQEHRTYGVTRPNFRMSSMGMCARKQIAERLGLPPTLKVEKHTRYKMWTGTVMGLAIQQTLLKCGFLHPDWHEKEVVYQSYVGHLDGYCPELNAIVEIKTSDDAAIKKPDWPENYLLQGMAYCLATNVPKLLVFQFGKNQGLSRYEIFEVTKEWKTKIDCMIQYVDYAWAEYEKTKQLPDHNHDPTMGWQDKWCPYTEDDLTDLQEELNARRRSQAD